MDIYKLYKSLVEAYSIKKLNVIASNLILWNKSKQYRKLEIVAGKISGYIKIDTSNKSKLFSKLIQIYHPDKSEQYLKTIEVLYRKDAIEELKSYEHILKLDDIDSCNTFENIVDVDYSPGYVWDIYEEDGFRIYDADSETDYY